MLSPPWGPPPAGLDVDTTTMMQPHRVKVGSSVVLVSVDGLAIDWGVPEKGVEKLLSVFEIPCIRIPEGEKRYVSLWALESALFRAGLPEALHGVQELVRGLQEAAGLIYASATKEAIRDRLKVLQRSLSKPSAATQKTPRKARVRTRGSKRG